MTSISCSTESAALSSSITVSLTVNTPAELYRCSGFRSALVAPSPNSQKHATISASSMDSLVNVTTSPTSGDSGVKANAAIGAAFPTWMLFSTVPMRPPLSVTVSVTVNSPFSVY